MSNLRKPSFNLLAILEAELEVIQVLDVGAMIVSEHCYANLMHLGLVEVTGFEPNPVELERLNQEESKKCTWLPYFLGDGNQATFHLTGYPGCSSLYEPNPEMINLFHAIGVKPGDNFSVVKSSPVSTKRLDDVAECPAIDFIKVDVQGGELDVLRHGQNKLKNVTVIQTEVEFVPIYKDQPLFGDIQVFLREQGFQFHKFIDIAGRCVSPFHMTENPHGAMSQALWADAIFVRDISKLDYYSDIQLLKAAVILHECYLSYDVVLYFLGELDARNGTETSARYVAALRQTGLGGRLFMNLQENADQ